MLDNILLVALLFIVVGVLAGTSSALIGFGGGFFVVPVMYWGLIYLGFAPSVVMHIAIGTSLMVMVITACNSTYRHHLKASILWPVFWRIMPFVAAGSLAAAIFTSHVNGQVLKYIFIAYLFYTILHSLLKKTFSDIETVDTIALPGYPKAAGFGWVVGFYATSLGVGGSVMTVPFFRRLKLSMARSAGMAVSLTLPVSVVGAVGSIIAGSHLSGLPPFCLGYVYGPAVVGVALGSLIGVPLGAKLSYKIPDNIIARSYLVILALVMVVMAL